MFPGKLGLFSHDLSLGLGISYNSQPYGKNPGIGQKYFSSFSKLHLNAGGLTGCPQAAAPGQFRWGLCWMRATFRKQHDWWNTLGRTSAGLSDWENHVVWTCGKKCTHLGWLCYHPSDSAARWNKGNHVLATLSLLTHCFLKFRLLKSLPCLSMGTRTEQTKKNEPVVNSLAQWMPHEEIHQPLALTFHSPSFLLLFGEGRGSQVPESPWTWLISQWGQDGTVLSMETSTNPNPSNH